jgi:hypothetical protein
MVYQIKIKGVLDESWSNWLGGVDICVEQMENEGVVTTLTVDFIDQATLFGILDRIRDLNLTLVSANPVG